MSRSVTDELRASVFAQETDEEFIVLVTINHDELSEPIRVNSSGKDIVSRSNTFLFYPFDITLPDDDGERPPRAKLKIDNVDLQIVETIRSLTSAPTVLIEIVRAADLDTLETSFPDFKLQRVPWNQSVVEGDLTLEEYADEPYPALVFSPADFPGLF